MWALTDLAHDLFPDRHDDLTVELIDAVRTALGDDGLDRVIDARADAQRAAYAKAIPERGSLRTRVEALARIRTEEGYVAEVVDDDGPGVLLVEHHCPICTAAAACPGLCRSELELFREVLGDRRRRSNARSTFSPATGAAHTECSRGRSVPALCALFTAVLPLPLPSV